jgi:hypothetical protein
LLGGFFYINTAMKKQQNKTLTVEEYNSHANINPDKWIFDERDGLWHRRTVRGTSAGKSRKRYKASRNRRTMNKNCNNIELATDQQVKIAKRMKMNVDQVLLMTKVEASNAINRQKARLNRLAKERAIATK